MGLGITLDDRIFILLPYEKRTAVFDLDKLIEKRGNLNPEQNLVKFKDELKKEAETDNFYLFDSISKKIDHTIRSAVDSIVRELGSKFGNIQSGGNPAIDFKNIIYSNKYGIISIIDGNKTIFPNFVGRPHNGEVAILVRQDSGEESEIYKISTSNSDWNGFEKTIRNYFLVRIDKLK